MWEKRMENWLNMKIQEYKTIQDDDEISPNA